MIFRIQEEIKKSHCLRSRPSFLTGPSWMGQGRVRSLFHEAMDRLVGAGALPHDALAKGQRLALLHCIMGYFPSASWDKDPPPFVDRMKDSTDNITLPGTMCTGGNNFTNLFHILWRSSNHSKSLVSISTLYW